MNNGAYRGYSLILLMLLFGCSEAGDGQQSSASGSGIFGSGYNAELEQAAIKAGLVVDPKDLELAGHYARSQDRFCARGNRQSRRYQIGILASFGSNIQCEGSGTALLKGEQVELQINQSSNGALDQSCRIEARFDGQRLSISGTIDPACDKICNYGASLAGAEFPLLRAGDEAAAETRGRNMEQLCAKQ